MKRFASGLYFVPLVALGCVQATPARNGSATMPTAINIAPSGLPDDVRSVSPALERYTQERLYGEVWNRPGLSKRDRSVVTVAALIARNQTAALPYYFGQAL